MGKCTKKDCIHYSDKFIPWGCGLYFTASDFAEPANCRYYRSNAPCVAKNTPDPVNHPAHYTSHPSGVECIQITEHYDFLLGNTLKYVWRAGLKDAEKKLEDLEKAAWYLNRAIENERKAGEK